MNQAIIDWWTVAPERLAAFIEWQDGEYLPMAERCANAAAYRYCALQTGMQSAWIELEDARLASQGAGIDNVLPPVPAPMLAGSARERLTLQLHRELGSKEDAPAPWVYVVQADIPETLAAEYNAWYDEEHLPRLVNVKGIRRARRFVAIEGGPRYCTAYDLDAADSFETPEAVKARKTPWTEKMRGAFLNSRRSMLRLEYPGRAKK